jgi:hypothetical protein
MNRPEGRAVRGGDLARRLAAGGFPLASFTHSVKLTESIGRLGLNYKWGSPVVARY